MTIFPKTSWLSEPVGSEKIPVGTFAYLRARNKNRVHDMVLGIFQKSGLSQADLARRLGKGPDRVCRMLGAPGNWTLDTLSDFLFAICGGEPGYSVEFPLRQPARNYDQSDWMANSSSVPRNSLRLQDEPTLPSSEKILARIHESAQP